MECSRRCVAEADPGIQGDLSARPTGGRFVDERAASERFGPGPANRETAIGPYEKGCGGVSESAGSPIEWTGQRQGAGAGENATVQSVNAIERAAGAIG